jgi:hypothetical protein
MMIRRYRIRGKPYLCLTPEEAVGTGVMVGEESVEEFSLITDIGLFEEYAAIRKEPEEKLKEMPALERGERYFTARREAVEYLRTKGPEKYLLAGVKSKRIVQKKELMKTDTEDTGKVEDIENALKAFGRKKT